MFKKIGVVLVVATMIAACSGFSGKGEGDSCGADGHDDCGANLLCQSIKGHGEVCCATPASASKNDNCKATP